MGERGADPYGDAYSSEANAIPPGGPSSGALSETTSAVHQLGEQQLLGILHRLGKTSVDQLSPEQRTKLHSLLPHEQGYSPQTPQVNVLLFEKSVHDLEKICKNPVYRQRAFNIPLPDPGSVRRMTPDRVRQLLEMLTARVAQMMEEVGFEGKCKGSPQAVLRDPAEMQRLLQLSTFSFLTNEPSVLWTQRKQVIKLLSDQLGHQLGLLGPLSDAAKRVRLIETGYQKTLMKRAKELPHALDTAAAAEDFSRVCSEMATTISLLAAEQTKLLKELCRLTKSRLERLRPHTAVASELLMTSNELLAGPVAGHEAEWLIGIVEVNSTLLPFVTLCDLTNQFLTAVPEEELSFEAQQSTPGDLKNYIIPPFRTMFPACPMSDEEIEHFVLSVYLKVGPRDTRSHAQTVRNALETYIESLTSSLETDFSGMRLRDDEIAWLAEQTLFNPSEPLPIGWRQSLRERMR